MLLKRNNRLVMTGDSVTDCGRAKPVGEGHKGELGSGYVLMTEALINSVYPELKIRVTNMGISGNTSADLLNRWQQDVLDLKPDMVSIMIGVNNVWRIHDQPYYTEKHISLEDYRAHIDEMTAAAQAAGATVVLMSPFFMETEPGDAMRAMCAEHVAVCTETAARRGAVYVDVQAAFERFLKHNYSAVLSWDRVHPNATGHMIIAKAFLDAIGFQW
jgi:lysophospholipase L1-like esterase